MAKWIFLMIVAVLAQAAYPAFGWAQAAAEYGILAAGSASAAAKVGSTLNTKTDKLADRLQQKTPKSPVSVMADNKKKLEEKSRGGSATVHVDSVPAKATVSVDGAVVANTPTDLTVPEGKHTLGVTQAGFLSWRREISVTRGASLSLKADLESKYKSVITLSIQK